MDRQSLKAEKRKVLGRKVKQLRREGVLPANVYGKNLKSTAVQVPSDEFTKVFSEAGETGLVDLKVNGQEYPVLIHNVQTDPVTDQALHVDFLQVNLKEKVTAMVPLEFTGESPAEKSQEGIVVEQMNEVEVEALPTDLPEKITVDVSRLKKVDDAIHVKDLQVDVELKEDPERIVVNVAPPAVEEVEEAPPAEEEGVPPAEEGEEVVSPEAEQTEEPEQAEEGQ